MAASPQVAPQQQKRICKYCLKGFRPKLPQQVYCSTDCQAATAARRRQNKRNLSYSWRVPRACKHPDCNVIFTPRRKNQNCCSKQCRDWLKSGTRRIPFERFCANPDCGKGFRSRVGNQIYCSDGCARTDYERKAGTGYQRLKKKLEANVADLREQLSAAEARLQNLPAAWAVGRKAEDEVWAMVDDLFNQRFKWGAIKARVDRATGFPRSIKAYQEGRKRYLNRQKPTK